MVCFGNVVLVVSHLIAKETAGNLHVAYCTLHCTNLS